MLRILKASKQVGEELIQVTTFDQARQSLQSLEKVCRNGSAENNSSAQRQAYDLVSLLKNSGPQGANSGSLTEAQQSILLRRMRVLADTTDVTKLETWTVDKVAGWNTSQMVDSLLRGCK